MKHYVSTIVPTSKDPSKKIFVRISCSFESFYVIFIEWPFYQYVISKCISTTLCNDDTSQFTCFLLLRLNITIVMIRSLQYLWLSFSLLKLKNGLKKHVPNVAERKYVFTKLVAIFLNYFLQCKYNFLPI